MANFVRCYDGTWINLDHVAKIDRNRDTNCYTFITLAGQEIAAEIDFDPAYTAPVMPAIPGEALFEFYAKSTERRPTSFEEIVIIETPILGWHCSLPRAKPVTYRPYIDRGASMYLYRMADGRFNDEWGDRPTFENFDVAKAYVLRRIQSQWNE